MKTTRRAVIDIGTNSVKLLVADARGATLTPVRECSEQTRLGRGFYARHRLQPGPVAQTAEAVARFAAQARELGAPGPRVIATSAARDARNPEALLRAVRRASGLVVEVISGEQEADWAYQGVASARRRRGCSLLILDVGGGSTEFILGAAGAPVFRRSHPLGAVRWLERLPVGDPPPRAGLAAFMAGLLEHLSREVAPALEPALAEASSHTPRLVGTGGTASVLGAMELELTRFDRDRLDRTRLPLRRILERLEQLWNLPLAQRRQLPGLPPERADVIVTGAAIYAGVMQRFGFPALEVSTRGVRFGAVLDPEFPGWRQDPPSAAAGQQAEAVRRACRELMALLDPDHAHVRQVTWLALRLFDQLLPLHQLDPQDRLWLEAAALLHDIGWSQAPGGGQHHKVSAQLIRDHPWRCLDQRAVAIVALVARYHRKALPKLDHEAFAALDQADRLRVEKLAALLRVADGLDNSHQHAVRALAARIEPGEVVLRLETRGAMASELAAAEKKSDLFARVYERPLRFEPRALPRLSPRDPSGELET